MTLRVVERVCVNPFERFVCTQRDSSCTPYSTAQSEHCKQQRKEGTRGERKLLRELMYSTARSYEYCQSEEEFDVYFEERERERGSTRAYD